MSHALSGVSRHRPAGYAAPAALCSRSRSGSRWPAARSTWGRGGSDNEKPKPAARKPARSDQCADVSDAKATQRAARCWPRSGKTEEALAEFDNALALDPYNAQALYGRGLIYQGQKQHQQAIEDFTAANGLSAAAGRAAARPGDELPRTRQDQGSRRRSRRSRAGRTEQRAAWTTRGVAYERLGDKAKAAASYSRAVALRPGRRRAQRPGAHRRLAFHVLTEAYPALAK